MTTEQHTHNTTPNDTTSAQIVNTEFLRLMIREAVERETSTVIATFRTQLQVQDGKLTQFNRDITSLMIQCGDLDELVRGNPKQNLIGLADQIKASNALLSSLEGKVQQTIDVVKREVLTEVERTRVSLNEVKGKQDDATRQREALINQARGARYAFYALVVVAGFPALKTISDILHLFP